MIVELKARRPSPARSELDTSPAALHALTGIPPEPSKARPVPDNPSPTQGRGDGERRRGSRRQRWSAAVALAATVGSAFGGSAILQSRGQEALSGNPDMPKVEATPPPLESDRGVVIFRGKEARIPAPQPGPWQ